MNNPPEYEGATKAKEHFNDTAHLYEEKIQKIVPHSSLFFSTLIGFIPDAGGCRLLELGSGTGFVTAMILAGHPDAEITCIDMSPEMLAVAREKPALPNVNLVLGDFREVYPEEKFDVVLTSLCMHHLNDGDRMEMMRKISGSLGEGGVFINGDVFRPVTEFEETLYRRRWLHGMIQDGLAEEDARHMLDMREENFGFLDTMKGYEEKLKAAGFAHVLCPYNYDFHGVFVAYL